MRLRRKMNEEGEYLCKYCNHTSLYQDDLARHESEAHNDNLDDYDRRVRGYSIKEESTDTSDLADIHLYSASREELIEHVESAIAKVAELEEELENAVKRGDELHDELCQLRKEDDSESTSWEIAIDREGYRELQERDRELDALTYEVEEVNELLNRYTRAKAFNTYDLQECLEKLLNKVDDLCSFDWNEYKNKQETKV